MICHVCEEAAIGQCKSCGKFYCKQHGDVYCVRCSIAVKPAGQPLEREVEFGVQAEAPAAPAAGATRCYACEAAAERACRFCGRFFCPQHGGLSSAGLLGPTMPLCEPCRQKQADAQMWGCMIAAAVLGASVILGLLLAAHAHG
jgi:hypothetical protein